MRSNLARFASPAFFIQLLVAWFSGASKCTVIPLWPLIFLMALHTSFACILVITSAALTLSVPEKCQIICLPYICKCFSAEDGFSHSFLLQ